MSLLEIACFTPEDALLAWSGDADRIELCNNRQEGGTTPSFESVLHVKRNVTIPVFAMIRPRGGNFVYTNEEFQQMAADVDNLKDTVDGYVFGILDEGRVDISRTSELVRRAHPLPCTFHRAFDDTLDKIQALNDVITSGCKAILSSGGASNAVAGAYVLADLVQQAQGRVVIMPGGGVREDNLRLIRELTRAPVFHSSAINAGRTAPEVNEVRRMKAILTAELPERSDPIEIARTQSHYDHFMHDDEDVEQDQPLVSAVSIGKPNLNDEFDRV